MEKILSFRIGDRLFGIDINVIKEINRNIEYTIVPGAADNVIGLFNMRGQIVTILSLSSIMGFGEEERKDKIMCLILKNLPNSPNQMGFQIQKTEEVIDIDQSTCEPPPANVDYNECKYIRQVARLKDELLMIIDTEKIALEF